MKTRPILFSGPMILALLAGNKTQTRRLAKFEPLEAGLNLGFSGLSVGHYCTGNPGSGTVLYSRGGSGVWNQRTKPLHCPYGKPGDLLWVRESCWVYGQWHRNGFSAKGRQKWRFKSIGQQVAFEKPDSNELAFYGSGPGMVWRASIHMPRWASRLTLRITDVRVQRLQEVSEADAIAEGAMFTRVGTGDARTGMQDWWSFGVDQDGNEIGGATTAAAGYELLWQSINGPGSWAANPWVWAITFEVIRANIDAVLAQQVAA